MIWIKIIVNYRPTRECKILVEVQMLTMTMRKLRNLRKLFQLTFIDSMHVRVFFYCCFFFLVVYWKFILSLCLLSILLRFVHGADPYRFSLKRWTPISINSHWLLTPRYFIWMKNSCDRKRNANVVIHRRRNKSVEIFIYQFRLSAYLKRTPPNSHLNEKLYKWQK